MFVFLYLFSKGESITTGSILDCIFQSQLLVFGVNSWKKAISTGDPACLRRKKNPPTCGFQPWFALGVGCRPTTSLEVFVVKETSDGRRVAPWNTSTWFAPEAVSACEKALFGVELRFHARFFLSYVSRSAMFTLVPKPPPNILQAPARRSIG